MPGKERVDATQPDDLGHIRILLEEMRAENRLTAESVDALGRQQSVELRSFEGRLGARLAILDAVGRSHGEELRGLKMDIAGLKSDSAGLRANVAASGADVASLNAAIISLDGKMDKVLDLEARVTALEPRTS
jgi:hypothetical protein